VGQLYRRKGTEQRLSQSHTLSVAGSQDYRVERQHKEGGDKKLDPSIFLEPKKHRLSALSTHGFGGKCMP
jgi:hypothetical protein